MAKDRTHPALRILLVVFLLVFHVMHISHRMSCTGSIWLIYDNTPNCVVQPKAKVNITEDLTDEEEVAVLIQAWKSRFSMKIKEIAIEKQLKKIFLSKKGIKNTPSNN